MTQVRKAVIPAAGLGSRFLPATKAIPKEMVPVVDRPAIQYVVEEAVAAGIDDILIITGPTKRPIEDHFDRAPELERDLANRGKEALAERVRAVAELAQVHTIRQGQPLGLGHAVGMARRHVGDEAFAVLLPDDIVPPPVSLLPAMVEAQSRTRRPVIALRRVGRDQISAYGCAAVEPVEGEIEGGAERAASGQLVRMTELVEKPAPEEAPSDLAVFGRYVFPPAVFDAIDAVGPGAGGEIQLTDAIARLAEDGPVYGWAFEATTFDTGTPIGFLRAALSLAVDHDELGPEVRKLLDELRSS